MSPTRVLFAFWVLAASAQAFVGGPAAGAVAAEPRVLRLRTKGALLRAAADKPERNRVFLPGTTKGDRCEIFWSPGEKLAQFR